MFNTQQIEEILRVIDFSHTLFIAKNIGDDVLTKDDKSLLKLYGVDVESIKTDFSPFEQQYYFGILSQALEHDNASQLSYNDFLKYLRRGQYAPLNEREQLTLNYAKQRTYSHIKGLGDRIKLTASGYIIEEDKAKRDAYELTIKNSLERAVIERDTVNSVISEIGHKTGDWARDLGRIAATEMEYIYEEGRAAAIEKEEGKEALVYKQVYKGACRHCIKFYTTNGIGSEPRVFKLSELRMNGTNIGRKQKDWKATLGPIHPWCRCILYRIKQGYVWDKLTKRFTPPKSDGKKPKLGIKIKVGDKVFER